jgi:hypothetical protein
MIHTSWTAGLFDATLTVVRWSRARADSGPGLSGLLRELLAWFPDDHACIDYLEWLCWPDGFRCPRCVSRAGWRLSCGPWEGTVCGRQRSVTAGTIFQRTRTPLPTWFAAGGGDDLPEAGSLRAWASAGAGARVLPDGAGDAAPVSFGDGAFRSAACEWLGGGRGGVRRGCRGCRARPGNGDQVDRRDRRGDQAAPGFRTDSAAISRRRLTQTA